MIILGDSLTILPSILTKSIDMVFVDPPYNLQLNKDLFRPDGSKFADVQTYRTDMHWDNFSNFNEYDAFTKIWLTECQRVMKNKSSIWVCGTYQNIYRIGYIMQNLGFWILNSIIWQKPNAAPNFMGVRFHASHEMLIWAIKDKSAKYTFNYQTMKQFNYGKQMKAEWNIPACRGQERIKINGETVHPTQKPGALLERVILASTNKDDLILDPFFGLGTTGYMAKRLGRRFIGIEQDPLYVSVAKQRIANVGLF